MKNIAKRILCVIAVIMVAACSRSRVSYPHPWPAINDVVDSLSQKLDYVIYHHAYTDSVTVWTEKMRLQAEKEPDNVGLHERVRYYEAMRLRMDGNRHASDSVLYELLECLDSASHPYLFNRVAWHVDNNEVRDVAAYRRIIDRLEYFHKAGDDFISGALYSELGNLLKNVRDPSGALTAYRSADSLYLAAAADDIATFNRVNIASALIVARDTISAIALLTDLLADHYVMSRPDVKEIVLEKLYNYSGDTTALISLYEMQGDNPGAVTLVGMSGYYLDRGDAVMAHEMSVKALDAALDAGQPDFAANALYAISEACAAVGDTAGAYSTLKDAVELTDEISIANEPDEIEALETMRHIASRRLASELQQSKATLKYVCIAFALSLLALAAAWIVLHRFRQLKYQRITAVRERDNMSRRLIATQIAHSESERLITTVGKEIGEMGDCGRISPVETRRIVSAIKSHSLKYSDRETFIETFGSMHPEFARRLRKLNSAFTEPDIRLAVYIVSGMETKHIADTMGVRPESVKQARWRLRTKMSLAKGESLEQALRSLLE